MTKADWPKIAQAMIDYCRMYYSWWFDGTEARCYGDMVRMTNPYDITGEDCVVCNKKFQDGFAVELKTNVDSAHINECLGQKQIVFFAHVQCLEELK